MAAGKVPKVNLLLRSQESPMPTGGVATERTCPRRVAVRHPVKSWHTGGRAAWMASTGGVQVMRRGLGTDGTDGEAMDVLGGANN